MMKTWSRLGFNESPYKVTPLNVTKEDAKLFVGREAESDRFLNLTDTEDGGVFIISGEAGIGKTSFLNVNQYRMISEEAGHAPKLIPSIVNTGLSRDDDETSVAQRCVHRTIQNVVFECTRRNLKVPNQITKIEKWMSHKADSAGIGFGFQILGVGGHVARPVTPPAVGDATKENWQDILSVVASECVAELDVEGVVICFDNVETLDCADLAKLMMAFRDTLFMTRNVWWVLIGQSQLYAQLNAIDQRISQRINGPGVVNIRSSR